ncbi:MAG: hypothetical protein H3C43_07095, partial [Leptonema sp. (in: Bacteria)]|nr:hypothetical protein [Leptonema sp. (in: bacteria)]
MSQFSKKILATSVMAILMPFLFMLTRLILNTEPLSMPLLTWLSLEAIFQIGVFFSVRLQWLNLAQYKTAIFAIWFIIGLPVTILCIYSGVLPEFRLTPYLVLLLTENQISKSVYTLLLLIIGILVFLPFYQGTIHSLAIDLFRPFVLTVAVFSYRFIACNNRNKHD